MVSEQPTRKIVSQLREAGFVPARTTGSHTYWKHPRGVAVPVPDGHKEISPGVYRQVVKAIAESAAMAVDEEL